MINVSAKSVQKHDADVSKKITYLPDYKTMEDAKKSLNSKAPVFKSNVSLDKYEQRERKGRRVTLD